jgi:hypothetical protein
MPPLTGLAQFRAEKKRREEAAAERNKPKANYFNWKKNKDNEDPNTVYVRFLQEFDKDIDTFNPDRGLPIVQVEHTAPGKQGYLRRANCTKDEGECYACERHAEDKADAAATGRKDLKGWGPKSNFYIWALVDYKDGDGPQPVVISRGFNSSFYDDLVEEVETDENNRITDKMFKITRSGSDFQTTWKLRPAKGVELYDDTDVEVLDLEDSVLRKIPYDEQPAYYGAVYKDGDELDSRPSESEEAKPQRQATGEIKW